MRIATPVVVLAQLLLAAAAFAEPACDLLFANGRIVDELKVPPTLGQGNWIEFERDVELSSSAWIAARAFSLSLLRTPDADAHTNPVYVYLNGKAPYDRESLDAWLTALDQQIAVHRVRKFDGQAKVLDYLNRSRDILTAIRAMGGAVDCPAAAGSVRAWQQRVVAGLSSCTRCQR